MNLVHNQFQVQKLHYSLNTNDREKFIATIYIDGTNDDDSLRRKRLRLWHGVSSKDVILFYSVLYARNTDVGDAPTPSRSTILVSDGP